MSKKAIILKRRKYVHRRDAKYAKKRKNNNVGKKTKEEKRQENRVERKRQKKRFTAPTKQTGARPDESVRTGAGR